MNKRNINTIGIDFSTKLLDVCKNSRFKFQLRDNLVKWEDTARYYHIYNKVTIMNLLEEFNIAKKI